MESEALNKAIVGRWFASFWGDCPDLAIVDELAAPRFSCSTRCIGSGKTLV